MAYEDPSFEGEPALLAPHDELRQVYHLAMSGVEISYEEMSGYYLALYAAELIAEEFDADEGDELAIHAFTALYETQKNSDDVLEAASAMCAAEALYGYGQLSAESLTQSYFLTRDLGAFEATFFDIRYEDEMLSVASGSRLALTLSSDMLRVANTLDRVGVPGMDEEIEAGFEHGISTIWDIYRFAKQAGSKDLMDHAYKALQGWYEAAVELGIDVTEDITPILEDMAYSAKDIIRADLQPVGMHAAADLVEFWPDEKRYRRLAGSIADRQALRGALLKDFPDASEDFVRDACRRIGSFGRLGFLKKFDEFIALTSVDEHEPSVGS